jgi:hypothetical protein
MLICGSNLSRWPGIGQRDTGVPTNPFIIQNYLGKTRPGQTALLIHSGDVGDSAG